MTPDIQASSNTVLDLDDHARESIAGEVERIIRKTPSLLDYRFYEQVQACDLNGLQHLTARLQDQPNVAVVVTSLPEFDDVNCTKILALMLTRCAGATVAYGDFKGSLLTDIRPNPASSEQNAQRELLGMQNDFPFVKGRSRPAFITLTAHLAEGRLPMTLLARARDIVERLSHRSVELLQMPIYRALVGHKLAWESPRLFRFPLLLSTQDGWSARFHFDSITVDPDASGIFLAEAESARNELSQVAYELGLESGFRLAKGSALIVPNDFYLHGREAMNVGYSERLVFRGYALARDTLAAWESPIVRLDDV